MTDVSVLSHDDAWRADSHVASQFTMSALGADLALYPTSAFHDWWEARHRATRFSVTQIPFSELDSWKFAPGTENLVHESGHFFTIQGLQTVTEDSGSWCQPIINQSEIGILGILAKEFNGVLHFLMQAKIEPGNINALQLSPTVQATRSNYTRVHGGADTRYLEYFRGDRRAQVLVDVLQSEQGAWFWHKRNRNMVVRVTEDVPVHDDFFWLTLHQIRELLSIGNLVNMDTRAVMACMKFARPKGPVRMADDPYTEDLLRSYEPAYSAGLHTLREIVSWLTEAKTRCGWTSRPIALADLANWSHTAHAIADDEHRRLRVISVSVTTESREIRRWTQPLLAPRGTGLVAFLTKTIEGALHLLVRARPEPGLLDKVEIGPSVQCAGPGDAGKDEPFFEHVVTADLARVRYDTVLSEEGGRFYHAQTRYQVIEADETFPVEVPDDYCWVTVSQLMNLLRHGHYLNIEARSLLACLHSLW